MVQPGQPPPWQASHSQSRPSPLPRSKHRHTHPATSTASMSSAGTTEESPQATSSSYGARTAGTLSFQVYSIVPDSSQSLH